MESKPERELIARTLQGNREAFSELVNPHLWLFAAGIHRILPDRKDTQSALEEALLSIHAELPRFRGDSRFSTWAYHLCIEEALAFRRSRMRSPGEAGSGSFWEAQVGSEPQGGWAHEGAILLNAAHSPG